MSTQSLSITSAKISNKSFKKHEGQYGEYGTFKIYPTLPKQDKQTGEWKAKLITYSCTISGYALQRFLKVFSESQKNYITIIGARIKDFHIEKMERTSKDGTLYTEDTYKWFQLDVNDFDIRHEPLDEQGDNAYENKLPPEEARIDDDIPF